MAQGEEAALEAFYAATSSHVHGLALRIVRESACAEEVTVDVFAQAWRQARAYDPRLATVLGWLRMLTRSRAIDLKRSRGRYRALEQTLDEDFDAEQPGAGPLASIAAGEHAARVRRALHGLPCEQRRAIEAAFFDGMTHPEVAARLGQPLGTVKTRIRTGLAALRRALSPLTEELA
jgi:RNA polymerase sigma-70 factor (ECF subfamily)